MRLDEPTKDKLRKLIAEHVVAQIELESELHSQTETYFAAKQKAEKISGKLNGLIKRL